MKRLIDSENTERLDPHSWEDDNLEAYDQDPRRPPYNPDKLKLNPPRETGHPVRNYR